MGWNFPPRPTLHYRLRDPFPGPPRRNNAGAPCAAEAWWTQMVPWWWLTLASHRSRIRWQMGPTAQGFLLPRVELALILSTSTATNSTNHAGFSPRLPQLCFTRSDSVAGYKNLAMHALLSIHRKPWLPPRRHRILAQLGAEALGSHWGSQSRGNDDGLRHRSALMRGLLRRYTKPR
jgi:hypothetical protein